MYSNAFGDYELLLTATALGNCHLPDPPASTLSRHQNATSCDVRHRPLDCNAGDKICTCSLYLMSCEIRVLPLANSGSVPNRCCPSRVRGRVCQKQNVLDTHTYDARKFCRAMDFVRFAAEYSKCSASLFDVVTPTGSRWNKGVMQS
jgi:hypothetical protein